MISFNKKQDLNPDLVSQKFEGRGSDCLVDVDGALDHEAEDDLGGADVLQDGATNQGTRVATQVEEEGLDDRAAGIARVLEVERDCATLSLD